MGSCSAPATDPQSGNMDKRIDSLCVPDVSVSSLVLYCEGPPYGSNSYYCIWDYPEVKNVFVYDVEGFLVQIPIRSITSTPLYG